MKDFFFVSFPLSDPPLGLGHERNKIRNEREEEEEEKVFVLTRIGVVDSKKDILANFHARFASQPVVKWIGMLN